MFRNVAAASCLALACVLPLQQAAAQDPLAGGLLGGAIGGILGGAVGGRGGAVAGAIIGGTTGAAIAADGQRRNGYYWYRDGCYVQQPDGSYAVVPPAYCGGPGPAVVGPPVGPAAVVDDDEVEYINPGAGPGVGPGGPRPEQVAACARKFRSYDARSLTFLSTDGTRKHCP